MGCSWGGTIYSDARPSYFNLFTEPRTPRRMFGLESNWGCKRMRGAAVEADAIAEQQPKRTRSGAAAEADANGKQQMKLMQSGQGAAADSKRTQAASSS